MDGLANALLALLLLVCLDDDEEDMEDVGANDEDGRISAEDADVRDDAEMVRGVLLAHLHDVPEQRLKEAYRSALDGWCSRFSKSTLDRYTRSA